MIYSAATLPVNPPGEEPLTREQLWNGLALKARDARLFLPPGFCTKCEILHEGDGFFVRRVTIRDNDLTEIVTFEPTTKISFHQFKGPREGVIVNEVLEQDDGSLHLRFYCLLGLKGVDPDGPEEQQEKTRIQSEDQGYRRNVLSTLDRIRSLVKERKL